MHATSVTTVILSVLLSLATATGAVLVITGLFLDSNGASSTQESHRSTEEVAEAKDSEEPAEMQVDESEASEAEIALQRRVNTLESRLTELTTDHQRAVREAKEAREELREALSQLRREGPVSLEAEEGEVDEEWLAERFAAHPEVSNLLESDEFEDAFRETLERIEEERRIQEIEERLERMERANERTYENYLDRVTEEVGLTPTQRSSLQNLVESRAQDIMRLYDPRIPRDERGNWREIHREFEEQVQSVLSPQQYQMYEENELGNMRQYRERRGGRGGGGSDD